MSASDSKRTSHRQLLAILRRGPSGPWREDNNNRADLYATVEVNHVLVGHANAARRYGSADGRNGAAAHRGVTPNQLTNNEDDA